MDVSILQLNTYNFAENIRTIVPLRAISDDEHEHRTYVCFRFIRSLRTIVHYIASKRSAHSEHLSTLITNKINLRLEMVSCLLRFVPWSRYLVLISNTIPHMVFIVMSIESKCNETTWMIFINLFVTYKMNKSNIDFNYPIEFADFL